MSSIQNQNPRVSVYSSDDVWALLPGWRPSPTKIPYEAGKKLTGVYYDGHPQLIKGEETQPTYKWTVDKDVMIPMRDGVRLAIDVYRPDNAEGEKFPVILCIGEWGKDGQDCLAWYIDYPQDYFVSPFWNGSLEGGDFTYTVPRGFVHIIAEPRGLGNSEGVDLGDSTQHNPKDMQDIIDWATKQPWSNGKAVMMGPSSYGRATLVGGADPHPNMVAIRPSEGPSHLYDNFSGIKDSMFYNVHQGLHSYDQLQVNSNLHPEYRLLPKYLTAYSKEEGQKLVQEILDDPDVKWNPKFYPQVKYPTVSHQLVDELIYLNHPTPVNSGLGDIKLPMYIGACWNNDIYCWATFECFRKSTQVPDEHKKLMIFPPMNAARPFYWFCDEDVRWNEYWTKGIDNGIMDEPRVKIFTMGVNKWKFENEWPLARTQYTKFYLQPGGGLSPDGAPAPATESWTQQAPYMDATVYCLRYATPALEKDMEITGHMALRFDAEIDTDDTNWLIDVIDLHPDGSRFLVAAGYLKAKFNTIDEDKSLDYYPCHKRQEPIPIVPGEVNRYEIAIMPTSCVFQKGHKMELIVRNQSDMRGKMARNGIYWWPFMRTVTHTLHLGNSYLEVPIIPE
ncbi:MAG: CocE/NonD family hydrolase [Clostridiales Family XIII bacterium]|jgi:putative CocE/NonD family hydrolase|nr:CocE/NonD family hydrolase [Clostridiales Family XIII bacterium]